MGDNVRSIFNTDEECPAITIFTEDHGGNLEIVTDIFYPSVVNAALAGQPLPRGLTRKPTRRQVLTLIAMGLIDIQTEYGGDTPAIFGELRDAFTRLEKIVKTVEEGGEPCTD